MMNKQLANQIALEVEAAVKAVADKHGLVARVEGGKYDSAGYYPNLRLTAPEADQHNFETWAVRYGLRPDLLGKDVLVGGHSFKITGVDPAKPKYPVKATRWDGKAFKLTVESVKGATRPTTKVCEHGYAQGCRACDPDGR